MSSITLRCSGLADERLVYMASVRVVEPTASPQKMPWGGRKALPTPSLLFLRLIASSYSLTVHTQHALLELRRIALVLQVHEHMRAQVSQVGRTCCRVTACALGPWTRLMPWLKTPFRTACFYRASEPHHGVRVILTPVARRTLHFVQDLVMHSGESARARLLLVIVMTRGPKSDSPATAGTEFSL